MMARKHGTDQVCQGLFAEEAGFVTETQVQHALHGFSGIWQGAQGQFQSVAEGRAVDAFFNRPDLFGKTGQVYRWRQLLRRCFAAGGDRGSAWRSLRHALGWCIVSGSKKFATDAPLVAQVRLRLSLHLGQAQVADLSMGLQEQ
ncbi:hypothetical protein FQZ97_837690 [compost metagenome]